MKVAAALLRQWYNENPARLLQAALWQAERLAEMALGVEALRAKNRYPASSLLRRLCHLPGTVLRAFY